MAQDYVIRPLQTGEEFRACYRLQQHVWGEDCTELVAPSHLMLARRIGGVAAGAFAPDGSLAGFIYGLTGIENRQPVHWSDMLAVDPDDRDAGLGGRLKRWQRDAVLPLGVETVYWTFDPLESRNAYLNFARLGVVCDEYARDLYGDTDSPLHTGLGTDRLVVRWPITSERVRRRLAAQGSGAAADRAAGQHHPSADFSGDDIAGVPLANPTRPGSAGPRSDPPDLELDAPRLRLAIPADIQLLKARAPAAAREWRTHTRAAFEHYFERGYTAVEVVREGERTFYILARDVGPRFRFPNRPDQT